MAISLRKNNSKKESSNKNTIDDVTTNKKTTEIRRSMERKVKYLKPLITTNLYLLCLIILLLIRKIKYL
jgi:hypothetical protein